MNFRLLINNFFVTILLMSCSNDKALIEKQNIEFQKQKDSIEHIRLLEKEKEAFDYCLKKDFNTDFCMLTNYNIHSGKPRFFIYNFKENKFEDSGLVSHGCANYPWGQTQTKDSAITSNEMESHCSSLGKYKISVRAISEWGIKIKYNLIGLEKTNNNAAKRFIVLHSWEAVSDNNIYPRGTPEGWGCPAVSNNFMRTLDAKLQFAGKPVLLWVFN